MLFLMSAGLTLVFGIMQVINLAHGSFYMIGAYVGATVSRPYRVFHSGHPGSFAGGRPGGHAG
jgi:branched-chain amino acid transport system permease protein